ncbi:hypothetical protein PJ311_06650 [Bacillus sp. CLL-7-23]|uniref:Uncharacterized protein n=1 Tax=Bacillus changyiensis TaxID=3004103 RepID=A0ABT4X3H7_9BACI|nr:MULTISPECIES: hypothetical protein [Bacillus]MDA1475715.1 hypothetical protein [Bacillus changyiensis]MDA7026294.1 hypothetical protein [Bacillus changyiensis]NPC92402.1 hypothetical protein [Bacillus sp. WMMC1349]
MNLKDDPDIRKWVNNRPWQAFFISFAMVISTMSIGLFKGFYMWTIEFLIFSCLLIGFGLLVGWLQKIYYKKVMFGEKTDH